jgi:hypothetical protein
VTSVVSPVCPPNLVISWVEQHENEDTFFYFYILETPLQTIRATFTAYSFHSKKLYDLDFGGHNGDLRERELATREGPERRGCFRKAFYVLFGTIIGLGNCDNPDALTQSKIPRMQ